jgi:hypothetical protein
MNVPDFRIRIMEMPVALQLSTFLDRSDVMKVRLNIYIYIIQWVEIFGQVLDEV